MGEILADGERGADRAGASLDCEARFRLLLEAMADGYVRVDMDGRIVETNAVFRRMLGYDAAELRAMTYVDLTPARWHAMEARIVEKQILGRDHSEVYEKEYRRKDGTVFPVELRAYLVREEGRPVAMWALVRDVTERRRTEDALVASEELFRVAFDAAPIGIALMRPDGRPLRVNPALCAIVGRPAGELLAGNWRDFTHPDDVAPGVQELERATAAPGEVRRMEKRYRRGDGSYAWVDVTTRAVRSGGDTVTHFISAVADISARKRAEEDLRASQDLFRTLAESSPVGIFRADGRGNVVYANPVCGRAIGIPSSRLLESGWIGHVHPDDRADVERGWRETVSEGRVYQKDTRFLAADGTVVWAQVVGTRILDVEGKLTGYVGVIRDVTKSRALEEQMVRNQRLSALGTLMAGVAHEINTPLASMHLALEIVREEAERSGASRRMTEAVAHVLEDAERIARFVGELNVVGRPDATRERVALAGAAEKALRWLGPTLPAGVEVRIEVVDAVEVIASEGQLAQLVTNLVTHAARSLPVARGGRVRVRVGAGLPGMGRLEVEDDGEGLSAQALARLFEPFFAGASRGRSGGLGLSVCHAIVTALGGSVEATSVPGAGTTLRVDLPLAPT